MIVGIIVILLAVGLSGCSETKLTTVTQIREHTNDYIGKTVTIKGTCYGGDDNSPYAIFDEGYNNMYALNLNNVVKPSKLYSGTLYKFTGIVRDAEYTDKLIMAEYYLEVSKIETA